MPSLPLTINFGSSGDYKLWAGDGWLHDANDTGHTWAGHVAKLRVMLQYSKDDLLLELDLIPVQAPGVEQELFVFINGAFVAYWPVADATMKSALVEANFLTARECLITFLMPKAICPLKVGISNDERILGLAFRSLSLSAIN